ncbi:MAG: glycosyltransferase family 4 protein [bacterium]
MRKSLLFTIDFPPPNGGVAKYYENICAGLPLDNISVLCEHEEKESEFDKDQKYKIYRKNLISKSPIWPKWILSFFYLRKISKKEKSEIILVGQILPLGTVAWLCNKIFKLPYAVFIHGMDIEMAKCRPRKRKLAKKILENAEFIIANSRYTKNLVINEGIRGEKIEVIYPCVNTRIYANVNACLPCLPPAQAGRKHGRQANQRELNRSCQPVLLTVGRLVKRKGHDMVIKALPKVIEKFPNIEYIIAGDGIDRGYIEDLTKKYDMGAFVKILGNISDEEKFKLMAECDIFISPSRNISGDVEGFGIVYLEAALYGKPVIAGNSGGAPEAVIDGQTGILVDPENLDEIADTIIKLLTDPDLANKLGVHGRERVLLEFTWDRQIEKIKKLLE